MAVWLPAWNRLSYLHPSSREDPIDQRLEEILGFNALRVLCGHWPQQICELHDFVVQADALRGDVSVGTVPWQLLITPLYDLPRFPLCSPQ